MQVLVTPITSLKTRDAAEKVAATMKEDADLVAKVVERKDGRFVVALHDKETGEFIGCI